MTIAAARTCATCDRQRFRTSRFCSRCVNYTQGRRCVDCDVPITNKRAGKPSTRCHSCHGDARRTGYLNSEGYLAVTVKGGYHLVHRLVMSEHLGRPLHPGENVHHIDGDRMNNDISNLELWSTSQPKGQRVEDKTRWAVEWLAIYAPHLLKGEAL